MTAAHSVPGTTDRTGGDPLPADGADAAAARSPEGKVALVTGSSRGIGLAVAEALVARGDRVCLTGRDPDTLARAVEHLGPERAMGVAGKVHDPAHRREVVDRVMTRWGRVDHLVNNAGINPAVGALAEADLTVVHKVLEVNVVSALALAQATWEAWQRDNGGTVVNVASVAGVSAFPLLGAYGISKAALISMTQQLAHELAPGVRVNAVAPAVVRTRFAAALYEGREAEAAAAYPLGRLGAPEDVGGAVAFLTSRDSGWITGQTLLIDGGLLLGATVT
ncbi:SDR family oxidoreductase [Streptomyces spiramenti]|uniref:SDR family oxidoreductase n=1 Tax=Streptomyces spiramenti TaxID=2720606 RepID=A0ABX1AQJ0_9ACTN|nr:SDR family oxidoreductase [Streptomyces spiramenti]NJP67991.1 SDR family oxidoreductase [Streptomyces spiramenti]